MSGIESLTPERYAHGTRARYVGARCRCEACRRANREYVAARTAAAKAAAAALPGAGDGARCTCGRKLYAGAAVCATCRTRLPGVWNGLVSAAPVRRHLRRLSAQHVGYKTVADAAGVSRTILNQVRTGKKRKLRAATAAAVLAVTADARADHSLMPAAQTLQRLAHLRVEYFTKAAVAAELGYRTRALQVGRSGRVTARTELRVRKLWRRAEGLS